MRSRIDKTQVSYDLVAREYAQHYFGELEHKPFDREMLDRLEQEVNGLGPICDLGCGPGQIARYLHHLEVPVCGIDLSAEMVGLASLLNPEISFQQGNMLALTGVADNSFGGIAAFYSIIHIPREALGAALGEIKRVLQPNGVLLLTFHIGQETIHRDEWWGKTVAVDFIFYELEEMRKQLSEAGYEQLESFERAPYEQIEYPSRRAYIFARKPLD